MVSPRRPSVAPPALIAVGGFMLVGLESTVPWFRAPRPATRILNAGDTVHILKVFSLLSRGRSIIGVWHTYHSTELL